MNGERIVRFRQCSVVWKGKTRTGRKVKKEMERRMEKKEEEEEEEKTVRG